MGTICPFPIKSFSHLFQHSEQGLSILLFLTFVSYLIMHPRAANLFLCGVTMATDVTMAMISSSSRLGRKQAEGVLGEDI